MNMINELAHIFFMMAFLVKVHSYCNEIKYGYFKIQIKPWNIFVMTTKDPLAIIAKKFKIITAIFFFVIKIKC